MHSQKRKTNDTICYINRPYKLRDINGWNFESPKTPLKHTIIFNITDSLSDESFPVAQVKIMDCKVYQNVFQ